MTEQYPYWAYAAVPGTLSAEEEKAALEEGRRYAALSLAVEAGRDTSEGHLHTARKFEAYLKGEQ